MMGTISVLAVEKSAGYFHIISEKGELELCEGGCGVNPGVKSFEFPYNHIAKEIEVPKNLIDRLYRNVMEFEKIMEIRNPGSSLEKRGDKLELGILKDERKLALLTKGQGVNLDKYFESYEGSDISW